MQLHMDSNKHPLSAQLKSQLPEKRFENSDVGSDDSKCNVCFEEYTENVIITRLTCMHIFHKECIHKWFNDHNTCPVCRIEIKGD